MRTYLRKTIDKCKYIVVLVYLLSFVTMVVSCLVVGQQGDSPLYTGRNQADERRPPNVASHQQANNGSINYDLGNPVDLEKVPIDADPERRTEPLGKSAGRDAYDLSALAGMHEEYTDSIVTFADALIEALRVSPLTRRRFYNVRDDQNPPFPDAATPVYDRDVTVPLVLLPRPQSVRLWSVSSNARTLGWRTEHSVNKSRGSVFGRTLIFRPGILSRNPDSFPASPFGTYIPSWILYCPGYDDVFFLSLGKVVLTPQFDFVRGGALIDRSSPLRLGEDSGATLLGEIITVPPYPQNTRLRWVSIDYGSWTRRFLAYSMVDGNGALRRKISDSMVSGASPYVRPLACEQHQPRINAHDELLLPSPTGWPPNWRIKLESTVDENAHEEWCLDEWFPEQRDACWVIRETEDSKPLKESFLLMPASQPSDRPVFFIALFAETEPKQLVKELASLYKVSPDTALNSPETMQRLNSLYEKVRDFPLDK